MEQRVGRQTPTRSVIIPYSVTCGEEAIKLYNLGKEKLMPWQELQLCDIMAVNDNGLWIHTKYGFSISRRNGKTEVLEPRIIWGLFFGEKILYTAHRTTTSTSTWERICVKLTEIGLVEDKDFITKKQKGLEEIRIIGGGRISFRTRSTKGGLGEGFSLVIIDEAQEYTIDQETALKYVVSDSKNPQTIYCGTPPTTVSAGTVFMNMRNDALQGLTETVGWAEWSVDYLKDPHDKESWYETNPSLGIVLTERAIQDENTGDDIDFNIQRLGLWLSYNQKSAISKTEWNECKIIGSEENKKLIEQAAKEEVHIAVKYGYSGEHVSMSIATKLSDERVFVETIDCQPTRNGDKWIVDYVKALKPRRLLIDGSSGKNNLQESLIKEKAINKARIKLPKVDECVSAFSMFEQSIFDKTLCHTNQPSLEQAVTNSEHRKIGKDGFGFRELKDGIEISIMDSAALACWSCRTAKPKKEQKISY